jgi:hypothetical protein
MGYNRTKQHRANIKEHSQINYSTAFYIKYVSLPSSYSDKVNMFVAINSMQIKKQLLLF